MRVVDPNRARDAEPFADVMGLDVHAEIAIPAHDRDIEGDERTTARLAHRPGLVLFGHRHTLSLSVQAELASPGGRFFQRQSGPRSHSVQAAYQQDLRAHDCRAGAAILRREPVGDIECRALAHPYSAAPRWRARHRIAGSA